MGRNRASERIGIDSVDIDRELIRADSDPLVDEKKIDRSDFWEAVARANRDEKSGIMALSSRAYYLVAKKIESYLFR